MKRSAITTELHACFPRYFGSALFRLSPLGLSSLQLLMMGKWPPAKGVLGFTRGELMALGHKNGGSDDGFQELGRNKPQV